MELCVVGLKLQRSELEHGLREGYDGEKGTERLKDQTRPPELTRGVQLYFVGI
jgi:hypothetical protein